MDIMGLLAALLLPWLLGVTWLRARWLHPVNLNWPTLLGYGYIAGALATTLVMRLLDLLGMRLSFTGIALTLVLLIALGAWAGRGSSWRGTGPDAHALTGWERAAFAGLLALIAIRLAGLGLEIAWQPLFPWDAWSQWATKARVWYELGHLAPFVPEDAWLHAGGSAFWDRAPHYPPAIPLLQVWTSMGLGRWDDALMNFPWLLAAVALGLAFYGQARLWGVAPLPAMLFTWFLLTLPMLDTHVALAGYADLFMAAAYGLAAMAFCHWARTRGRWQGAMALLFAAGAMLVKQPGIAWALTLLPALWVALAPRTGLVAAAVAGTLLIVALSFAQGEHIRLLGYNLHLSYSPAWEPLWRSLASVDNWHLLFYLAAGALMFSLPRLLAPSLRAMTVLVAAAFTFIAISFFFTQASAWARDYTTINRALLHLAPLLLFYVMVLFHEAARLPAWLGFPPRP